MTRVNSSRGGKPTSTVFAASPFDPFVARHGATPRRGVFGFLVHDIGRRIIGGEFAEGAVLPNEDDLIARFAVSRTILREAMKCLASKGLIEIRTKTGTRTRSRDQWHHTDPDVMVWHYETGPTAEFLDSLADLRRVLEPAAAARAAERASAGEIATIGAALDRMRQTTSIPVAHAEADRDFHAAIFAASHNPILARLVDVISIGIFGNARSARPTLVEGYRRSIPFHEDVFKAIAARDPGRATEAARRLLDTWHPQSRGDGTPAAGSESMATRVTK